MACPERVLAVYAHPDDSEVACAGTLARWAAEGSEVRVVSVARGEKGGSAADGDLAEVRAEEAAAAASLLGMEAWSTLGFDDGEIENTTGLREMLVTLIRDHRPEAVLTHDPTAVFFGDGYVNHRDHRAVGWAVLDAVAPAAGNAAYFPWAGPPHRVAELYLSGTLDPNLAVDISATIEVKVAALACHRSQLIDAVVGAGEGAGAGLGGDADLVAELVRRRAAAEGAPRGIPFAETYRRLRLG